MQTQPLRHESSSFYQQAREAYSAVVVLARTESGTLNENLRRYALRVFVHCTAASDAASERQRAQSLRYARAGTLKLFAIVEAVACERQASTEALEAAKSALTRLLGLLDEEVRPASAAPAAAAAPPDPNVHDDDDDWLSSVFPEFDPTRVVPQRTFDDVIVEDDPPDWLWAEGPPARPS